MVGGTLHQIESSGVKLRVFKIWWGSSQNTSFPKKLGLMCYFYRELSSFSTLLPSTLGAQVPPGHFEK